MSLSPFDSFQSRFVTYLLNFPRMSNHPHLHTVTGHRTYHCSTYIVLVAPSHGLLIRFP